MMLITAISIMKSELFRLWYLPKDAIIFQTHDQFFGPRNVKCYYAETLEKLIEFMSQNKDQCKFFWMNKPNDDVIFEPPSLVTK
jgi:hypothetical protein